MNKEYIMIRTRKNTRKYHITHKHKISQKGGSYIEKYEYKPFKVAVEFLKDIHKKKLNFLNSRYLNTQMMDNDINLYIKKICNDEILLELYEFLKENPDFDTEYLLSNINNESDNIIKARFNNYGTNLNEFDKDKLIRISKRMNMYNDYMNKMSTIFYANFDNLDYNEDIEAINTLFEEIYFPKIMNMMKKH